ncbi:YndM family protein [Pseudoneobacillus sp. C159]
MKHVKALLIKFVATLAILYIILGVFNDVAFRNVFLISLVVTLAAYLIGDMFILPRTNNIVATLVDFGLAFLVIWWMANNLTYGDDMMGEAFTSALALGVFELFFHRYLANNILPDRDSGRRGHRHLHYQTEASEELTPVRPNVRDED